MNLLISWTGADLRYELISSILVSNFWHYISIYDSVEVRISFFSLSWYILLICFLVCNKHIWYVYFFLEMEAYYTKCSLSYNVCKVTLIYDIRLWLFVIWTYIEKEMLFSYWNWKLFSRSPFSKCWMHFPFLYLAWNFGP